jgi:hypothetical protein
MPNRNKQRGDELERQVVNFLRDQGYICERTLERGARSDGSPTWDIDLDIAGHKLKIECKRKKRGFQFIYDSLGDNDILILKQDRNNPLYVVSETLLLELLATFYEAKRWSES